MWGAVQMSDQNDPAIELEAIRADILDEVTNSTAIIASAQKQKERFMALLQRVDLLDRNYRSVVDKLRTENEALKARIRRLEGGA